METPATMQHALDAGSPCAPLVVHITDMQEHHPEDSLLGLLRQMPPGRYRHIIVDWRHSAMWELRHSGNLAQMVHLPAAAGHPYADSSWNLVRLFRRLRQLRPSLIHTHSTALQWLAALAGVPVRLHGASAHSHAPLRHGVRSWLARLLTPCRPADTLAAVDCAQFHPRLGPAAALGPAGYLCDDACVIGAVGPMDDVHGQAMLVQAFLQLVAQTGDEVPLRLLIIGDGPARMVCKRMLAAAGASHLAWLPGQREDVARLMRVMDIFAAPACTADSSTHIVQAMASGLPVVASQGGAHGRLVQTGWTGALAPQGETEMLADALADYVRGPGLARRHGMRGRRHVLNHHSLAAVALHYTQLYDRLLRATVPGR